MSHCGCRSVGECTHYDKKQWDAMGKEAAKTSREYFSRLRQMEYDTGEIYDAHNDGRECLCPYCVAIRKYRHESSERTKP